MRQFTKDNPIRRYCNERGRRVTPVFLTMLDKRVKRFIDSAIGVHNGGKVTLDQTVGAHVGLTE